MNRLGILETVVRMLRVSVMEFETVGGHMASHFSETVHHSPNGRGTSCLSQVPLRIYLLAICTLALGFAGCSKKLDTYPVTGKVRFPDGKPLEGGLIIFVSKDTGTQSRARIEHDGTFTLGTLSEKDGAVTGGQRVSVRPESLGPGAPPKQPLLPKYQSAANSGLEFNVSADSPNEFDIVVEAATRPVAAMKER